MGIACWECYEYCVEDVLAGPKDLSLTVGAQM